MRRLGYIAVIALLIALVFVAGDLLTGVAADGVRQEAMFYQRVTDPPKAVACKLCPRYCLIPDGKLGFCRARKNEGGTLISLGYSQPCAVHVDPIEKKPFFNYLPATRSFSIASAGCNLRCKFCQNWQISQVSPLESTNYFYTPEKIVEMAEKSGCRSIAYTYSEPTNFYEYMLATARLARARGIKNVYHSNGYINPEPLKELCRYLDAANIDLKGFDQAFYEKYCEADLAPVLETLKALKKAGVWLEITNLVIPGANDDPKQVAAMCDWIVKNLGPDVPLHFSRFGPLYQLTSLPPTPPETLEQCRVIALKAGLHYVYIGNLPGNFAENTYCPKCGKLVIKRTGYAVLETHLKGSACEYCGARVAGVWS